LFRNIAISPYFYLFLIVMPIANWLPGIIGNVIISLPLLGFDKITANWMTVPIYLFAALTLPILGYSSDRYKDRFYHALFCVVSAIVIYGLLMVDNFKPPLWLFFLCVYLLSPMQTLYPLMMSWVNETWAVDNQTRSFAIAIFNSVGNIVINFLSRYIWLPGDAPQFVLGKSTVMGGMAFLFLILVTIGTLQKRGILMPVDKDGKTSAQLKEERAAGDVSAVLTEKPLDEKSHLKAEEKV